MTFVPYSQQYFQDLDEQSIINIHLTEESVTTIDFAIASTLAVTEREVRSAIQNLRSRNIIPIMGISAIIEQLGTAYIRTDVPIYPSARDINFKKGLYYFADIDPNDPISDALYGLRNGIVHNASFYSRGQGPNQSNYNFVYSHEQTEMLIPATTPWDGTFPQTISLDTFTSINPKRLLNMVERAIRTAEQANEDGNLEIILEGGKHELIFRYLKWRPV